MVVSWVNVKGQTCSMVCNKVTVARVSWMKEVESVTLHEVPESLYVERQPFETKESRK
jgi:hypothetical protein